MFHKLIARLSILARLYKVERAYGEGENGVGVVVLQISQLFFSLLYQSCYTKNKILIFQLGTNLEV